MGHERIGHYLLNTMNIIFDIHLDAKGEPLAVQFINVSKDAPSDNTHPDKPGVPMRPIDALAMCFGNKAAQDRGGFSVPTNIPGHPVGTTRWDIIVAEMGKPTADPDSVAIFTGK